MSRSKTRLYFGKLPHDIRERDLEKFVRGYGRVTDISIKRGYGFVEFDDERDADDVVRNLNGRELYGERVIIEPAREPSRQNYGYKSRDRDYGYRDSRRDYRRNIPVRTDYRLLVENLSSRVNWQELKEIFNDVAEVTFSDAHKRERNTGIVEFHSKDDMKKAMKKMQGHEVNGKKIKISVEKVGGSRSRSRSRDRRSRSKSPKRRRRRSRSKSPKQSRSKSGSKEAEKEEPSKSKSRSRSKSEEAKSRSQSPEQREEEEESNHESGHESGNESPQGNGEEENGNEEDAE